MIEIGRWPRGVAPLASHIEVFRRKIEMRVLNRYNNFRRKRRNSESQKVRNPDGKSEKSQMIYHVLSKR